MTYLEKFKITNKLVFVLGGAGLIGKEITESPKAWSFSCVPAQADNIKIISVKENIFFMLIAPVFC